jgi:hypothetical protein
MRREGGEERRGEGRRGEERRGEERTAVVTDIFPSTKQLT